MPYPIPDTGDPSEPEVSLSLQSLYTSVGERQQTTMTLDGDKCFEEKAVYGKRDRGCYFS